MIFERLQRTRCPGQVVVSMVVVLALASPVAASSFSDDFERADGPVDGWTVNNGDWNIVNVS